MRNVGNSAGEGLATFSITKTGSKQMLLNGAYPKISIIQENKNFVIESRYIF